MRRPLLVLALLLAACSPSPLPLPGPDGSAFPPDANGDVRSDITPDNGRCAGDLDGDGYGPGCALGPDCDDTDRSVHPGAVEHCDGIDQNCDGVADTGGGPELDAWCALNVPGANGPPFPSPPACRFPGDNRNPARPFSAIACEGQIFLLFPDHDSAVSQPLCWRDARNSVPCPTP